MDNIFFAAVKIHYVINKKIKYRVCMSVQINK